MKPPYDLPGKRDCWGHTFRRHREKNLDITLYTSDLVIFFKTIRKPSVEICATYLNDTLHPGNKEYGKLDDEAERKLKCELKQFDKISFAVVEFATKSDDRFLYK